MLTLDFYLQKNEHCSEKEDNMQAIMETVFDTFYLSGVIILGLLMISRSKGNPLFRLFGIMAVTLGCGDAFHLIPRAYALWTEGLAHHAASLGIGKLITSVTMTVFYVILYEIWRLRYGIRERKELSYAVYGLAALRILLCLLPQNRWTSPLPPLSFAILRNLPFALLGLLLILLFYRESKAQKDRDFSGMWLSILLSFAFYIPVVLFTERFPLVGILMIPKTLAYVRVVWMGFAAMQREGREKILQTT